jgi:hypothetical protein
LPFGYDYRKFPFLLFYLFIESAKLDQKSAMTEPDPPESKDKGGKNYHLSGDFSESIVNIESTLNNPTFNKIVRYFIDEVGIYSTHLIAIIILQIAYYACAFPLLIINSRDQAFTGLTGLYFFCGCFPFLFGFFALIGFIRGLFLRSRQLIALGAIAGLLSIGFYIIGAAHVLWSMAQEANIPVTIP